MGQSSPTTETMSAPFTGLAPGFPAGPRTPEPTATFDSAAEARPPSPPRPRLRLKRRGVPHLSAPTQNFLASVAAADVPIPSIEIPDDDGRDHFAGLSQQLPQHPTQHPSLTTSTNNLDAGFLSVRGRSTFSPPKTPAPGALPSASSPSRYPNWSIDSVFSSSPESSPDPECGSSSRPSTARSTQTSSSSLFSRFSQLSDDEPCVSPDDEPAAGSYRKSYGLGGHNELRRNSASGAVFGHRAIDSTHDRGLPASQRRHGRKAAWTKAMSAHLWATYILYLQDPKVTPFRVSKSCVPPHGVLLRVAREAKRSWKGSKAMMAKTSANTADKASASSSSDAPLGSSSCSSATLSVLPSGPASASVLAPASTPAPASIDAGADNGPGQTEDATASKSGSSTPTATESHPSSTFMEWPFTNAATRAHLRELCRLKAATPGGGARGLQYMSRSPTPFTQATVTRHRSMRVTPNPTAPSSSTFATQDMAMSLVLSTSEAMQPQGPLAQLTRSGSNPSRGRSDSDLHAPRLDAFVGDGGSGSQSFSERLGSALRTAAEDAADHAMDKEESTLDSRRLGSPFAARSYGPSSSSSLAAVLGLSTSNTRQPHTVGPRRSLQSPVRLSRPSMQKRRTKHLSQDLRRRPGLVSDFFTEPLAPLYNADIVGIDGRIAQFSATSTAHNDDLFIPRTAPESMPILTSSSSAPQLTTTSPGPVQDDQAPSDSRIPTPAAPTRVPGLLDPAPLQPPARLGSPFSSLPGNSTSFSFPNRFSHPTDFDVAALGRPFATMQRIVQPKAVPARTNLASRLAYIDQRLRELNSRNDNNQSHRPSSPP